jgi:hypothetical protein
MRELGLSLLGASLSERTPHKYVISSLSDGKHAANGKEPTGYAQRRRA